MAKETVVRTYKDTDTGLVYEFKLNNFVVSFGANIVVTPVKGKGTDAEKRLPASHVPSPSFNEVLTIEKGDEYDAFVTKFPFFKEYIERMFEEAMKDYK